MIVLQQNLRSFTQWDFSHFRENLRNDLLKIIFRIVSPKTPKNRKFKNPVALRAVFFYFMLAVYGFNAIFDEKTQFLCNLEITENSFLIHPRGMGGCFSEMKAR